MKRKALLLGTALSLFLFSCSTTGNSEFEDYLSVNEREGKPVTSGKIDDGKDTSIVYKTGTKLSILANSFETKDGDEPQGNVKIHFSEYHSYGEILASGLPMIFKEDDGRVGQMVSAGMFDLKAEDEEGNELKLKEDKTITVDLACHTVRKGYDLFYLEEEKTKIDGAVLLQVVDLSNEVSSGRVRWKRTQNVKLKQSASFDASTAKLEEAKPDQPVEPAKNDDERVFFDLGVDTKKFSSLSGFQSFIWTLASDTVNQEFLEESWDDVNVEDSGYGYYLLSLGNANGSVVVPVVPMLEGEELEIALAEFKESKKQYEKELKQWNNEAIAQEYAKKYVASFAVNVMGRYNIDFVYHQLATLKPFRPQAFVDGKKLEIEELILISSFDGAKSVVSYTNDDLDKFFYIKGFKNALFIKATDGNQYVVTSEDFNAIQDKFNKENEGVINVLETSVASGHVDDLDQVFNTINPVL